MSYPRIKKLKNNPSLKGLAYIIPDVVFSTAAGVELKMQIILPWHDKNVTVLPKRPTIVFLQGSAWTFPDVNNEIPQLSSYARMGYVVATITHRNFLDGFVAPAFLEDSKTAIRFLRKHADEYGIDPDRICFWGTSSGGHTSMMIATTGDNPKYKTEEYAEYSDKVQVAVECFGPSALMLQFEKLSPNPEDNIDQLIRQLLGGDIDEKRDLIREMSPLYLIEKGKQYPPMLLIHGDSDAVVPYEQSELMYKALIDNNNDAEMICIENAPHEGSFWSCELHDEIIDFIKRKL